MPGCPNATQCLGMGPAVTPASPSTGPQCDGCMAGMAMPGCPDPSVCSSSCMMQMYFGASGDTCLFLESWQVGNSAQWAGAFFAIMLLALLREGLQVFRLYTHLTTKQEDNIRRMIRADHLKQMNTLAKLESSPLASPSGTDLAPSSASNIKPTSTAMNSTPFLSDVSAGRIHSDPDLSRHALDIGADSSSSPFGQLPPAQSDFVLHFFDSAYYFLSLVLGYLLMLVIMTYNIWLCLFVVFCCFFCHLVLNYLYDVKWKRGYLKEMKRKITEWQQQHGSGTRRSSGAGMAGRTVRIQAESHDTTGVLVQDTAKPTDAESCCPDPSLYDD